MTTEKGVPKIVKEIAGVSVERLATEFGGTPVFVYDFDTIEKRVEELRSFGTIRYAQKACSNLAVLKKMRELGVKVDAVSGYEVKRALAAGFAPQDIAYTADVFDDDALEIVANEAWGCGINVGSPDMIYQLACKLGDKAEGLKLTMRVNPGFGHGNSRKTNTGGDLSKHGVWFSQIHECVDMAEHFGMKITGIHMHIGSGSDFEHLSKVADMLECVVSAIGSQIDTISCGGGLPISYTDPNDRFDVPRYKEVWHKVVASLEKSFGHKYELEVEPGRYLVAESGYLVSRICAIKKQSGNMFYLVDAGFAHLVRPVMYGSYHPIAIARESQNAPLPNDELETEVEAVVAGPMCESGDVFTQSEGGFVEKRRLPIARVGDFLIIEIAGAYGSAMSSNYNSRPFAPEVAIEKGVPRLIRRKQTFEQMIENEVF